jgi:hypothetical protein
VGAGRGKAMSEPQFKSHAARRSIAVSPQCRAYEDVVDIQSMLRRLRRGRSSPTEAPSKPTTCLDVRLQWRVYKVTGGPILSRAASPCCWTSPWAAFETRTLEISRGDVQRKLLARCERVKSVDFHPTEPWLLAGLYNGNVFIWNHETEVWLVQASSRWLTHAAKGFNQDV